MSRRLFVVSYADCSEHNRYIGSYASWSRYDAIQIARHNLLGALQLERAGCVADDALLCAQKLCDGASEAVVADIAMFVSNVSLTSELHLESD